MLYPPAESNRKHKTDVITWSELPEGMCELNFRAPSSEELCMTAGEAYSRLAIASASAVGPCILVHRYCSEHLLSDSARIEVLIVAFVICGLVCIGFYRPLPRVYGSPSSLGLGVIVGGSAIACFVLLRLLVDWNTFRLATGGLLLLAVPTSLFAADQMTGHMIQWLSADHELCRNTMVACRNAWRGRFMTDHVNQLSRRRPSAQGFHRLQRYWIRHVRVASVYVLAVVVALVSSSRLINSFGIAFYVASTIGLFAITTMGGAKPTSNRFGQLLGLWFHYQKDTIKPPWMVQSPSGPELARSFLAYIAVAVLALLLTLLGLVVPGSGSLMDLSPGQTEVLMTAGLGIGLAPLQFLLICTSISMPTVSALRSVLACEEVEHESH